MMDQRALLSSPFDLLFSPSLVASLADAFPQLIHAVFAPLDEISFAPQTPRENPLILQKIS
jgi:hypothetical protein